MDIGNAVEKYFSDVFKGFGISVLAVDLIAAVIGDKVKESGISTLFAYGSGGIGIDTTVQFFLLSLILTGAKMFFMSDFAAKKFSMTMRLAMISVSAFVCAACFIKIFGWFRMDQLRSWLSFIITFGVIFSVYTAFTAHNEKKKNLELNEALRKLKEGV